MTSLETIISTYGYPALFASSLIEGETPVIIAGFLARYGLLYFPFVVLIVFFGAFCSDQFWFHVGRHGGSAIIRRRPRWQLSFTRLQRLFRGHPRLAIFGFRFMYGFRIIAPVMLGMSGLPPLRFLVLDALGVVLWTSVMSTIGYLFGHVASLVIADVRRHQLPILLGMAAIGLAVWLIYRIRRRRLLARLANGAENSA